MGRLLEEDDVVDWLLKRTEMYDATGHFVDENVVKKNIESQIAKIPSAQPAPYIDSIVSEIEKTISETRERGKHHDINVRANGEMICFGLQLALEIIEEKRNGRSDIQTGCD